MKKNDKTQDIGEIIKCYSDCKKVFNNLYKNILCKDGWMKIGKKYTKDILEDYFQNNIILRAIFMPRRNLKENDKKILKSKNINLVYLGLEEFVNNSKGLFDIRIQFFSENCIKGQNINSINKY